LNNKKIINILDYYDNEIAKMGILSLKCPSQWPHDRSSLEHVRAIIPEIKKFIKIGRIEKASRWLGFIQGVLWINKIYSLENLCDHNRENTDE